MDYKDFLLQKVKRKIPVGVSVETDIKKLFEWQRKVVNWSLKRGRCALFEDCGLGKTPQQLAYANEINKATGDDVLILAPLAVSQQTVREGEKFGIVVNITQSQSDIKKGINITNYERIDNFDAKKFGCVVLDESSILKAYTGATKRLICERFSKTPYKLACTATPAPNDLMELLNHAEFLGIMRSCEALSCWFIADQSQSGHYRLKGHAENDFWKWVASWAVCIEKPSDIGFSDDGYILPELKEHTEFVKPKGTDFWSEMASPLDMSATGFHREKKRTIADRVKKCAEIAESVKGQKVIWCYLNEESESLKRALPRAVEIKGSDKPADKESAAMRFINGDCEVLISKPSIFGYGLNFQNCHDTIFCGMDYSYESYYQAVRRFYRFGQNHPVNVYRVLGENESCILQNIERKAKQKNDMAISMAQAVKEIQTQNIKGKELKLNIEPQRASFPEWIRSDVS